MKKMRFAILGTFIAALLGSALAQSVSRHLLTSDELKKLVSANPEVVHARGGDGQTPLHFAATVEIAEYLLDHGADIDARDIDHESTPAQYMVRKRQEIVLNDIPDYFWIDGVVFVPNGVSERPNVRPRLIRSKLIDDTFEFPGGFRNTQQASLDSIADEPIFNEIRKPQAFRVLKNPLNVLEDVVESLQRLLRRQ